MIPCAIAFIAGMLVVLAGDGALPGLVAVAAAAGFAAAAVATAFLGGPRLRRPRAAFCALVLAFALAGILRAAAERRLAEAREDAARSIPEGRANLSGTVASFAESSGRDVKFVLDATAIETAAGTFVCPRPVAVEVRASVPAFGARYGARVKLPAEMRRPLGPRNPGGFDEASRARRRGVELVAWAPGFRIEPYSGAGRDPLRRGLASLRSDLLAGADRLFSGRPRGTFGALVLGERRRIMPEDAMSLRNAGLIHILAISGLHVVMVAAFVAMLLSLAGLERRVRDAVLAVFLVLYGFLAGFGPPVTRATVGAELVLAGRLFDRRAPALRHLAATALLLAAWRPFDVMDAGFQLSFAATTGLVLASPCLRGSGRPLLRKLGGPLFLSSSAQLFVLPVLARQFGCVPLAAPLANLAAVPIAAVLVPAGLLVLGAEMAAPVLAPLLAGSFWLVERGLFAVAALTETLAGRPLVVPPPPFALGVAHVAALVLFLRSRGAARRVSLACAAATTAALLAGLPGPRGDLLVRETFLDVGQGDACLIQVPHWGAVLVDAGDANEDFDMGASRVVPFLRHSGVRRLRAAVATHPHSDHYGGLPAVMRACPVESLWVSGASGPGDEGYEALLALADSARIGRRALAAPETLNLGSSVRLRVLHPPRGHETTEANDMSVVFALEAGGSRTLLMADAEVEAESLLIDAAEARPADVLKVGHHGSRTSSGAGFVAAVHPALAIVSVGRANRHGLPSPEIIDRLAENSADVLRTDERGAVVVEVRRGGLRWRTMQEGWRPVERRALDP